LANKIQVKRGLRSKLPTLALGEPALTTDTKEVFIGHADGNIGIATSSQLADKLSKSNGFIDDANVADAGSYFLRNDSLNTPYGDWATMLNVSGAISGHDLQIGQSWNVPYLPYAIRRGVDGSAWSPWEILITQPRLNTWLPLMLLNGWEALDSFSYRVGILRYADGLVMIQATIKNGATTGIVATVAGIGSLPKKIVSGNYYSRNTDSSVMASGALSLHPNGDITIGIGGPVQTGALQFTLIYNEREDA